jgi:predicted nicotinamide N-methyase
MTSREQMSLIGSGPRALAVYPTELLVAGRSFTLYRPRRALDDLLEDVVDGRDPSIPYWAEFWPASVALARYLLEMAPLQGRVLELGCGVGLAGLAAAAAGAEVLQTDIDERALELAALSATASGLSTTTCKLDWSVPHPELGSYSWIIGADILYERCFAAPLIDLLARHLVAGGRALLADPCRSVAEQAIATARDQFTVTTLRGPVEVAGRVTRVAIHELTRTR